MLITRLKLKNWRNFKKVDVNLRERVYVIGPNASGKSNFDVLRFLRDIAKPGRGRFAKGCQGPGRHDQVALSVAAQRPGNIN